MKKKCVVLFSGGLDSRLVVRIMQEQDFEIVPIFFNLPFGCGCCDAMGCSFNFSQVQGIKLKVFDCNKGELFNEYMALLKKAEHGTGASVNPCKDCKIFMLKHAKKFAKEKEIDLIVTGDVLGERPMSQLRNSLMLIEEKAGLKGRILRPLSAKLLPETDAERGGLVDREKLHDIQGRKREKQMALAKQFKINYPSPGGGCLLCEKFMKKRFKFLFERGLKEEEVILVNVGRHFIIDDCWVVIGRDKKENDVIENMKIGELIAPDFIGPSALILDKCKDKGKIEELIYVYSKEGSLEDRKKFEEFKI